MDDLETRLRCEFNVEIQKLKKRIDALENKPKSKKFIKPTVAQVVDYMRAYCREKQIQTNVGPQHFIDFYESKGWKVGKNPMKDWEASLRTWMNKDSVKIVPKAKRGEAYHRGYR